MCGSFEPLPSPLTGEGSGGGEDRTPSPLPTFPRQGGKGYLLTPVSPESPGMQVRQARRWHIIPQ
jgi:hypothetical protein